MGIFVTAALLAALGAFTFLVVIWVTQRQLLYFPSPGPVPPAAAIGSRAVDVILETEDGLRLGGFFVPGAVPASGVTVIVCNGNGGDRADRARLARSLAGAGHNVLLFDYRAFGGNSGDPSETGLAADARAALRYVETRAGIDRERIVYFGESLGAAVAARLAFERPPRALVLRSPFTTIADVGRIHYPYLPVTDALLFDRYRAIDFVRELRVPVLVIAGANDRTVPPHLSREIYEAAAGPKRFVEVPAADHNDPELAEGDALVSAVTMFIDEVLR